MEKPLLPDTNRPYDLADHRGVGEIMGKSEAEQGAETPEAAGSVETGAAERMHDRREVPSQI